MSIIPSLVLVTCSLSMVLAEEPRQIPAASNQNHVAQRSTINPAQPPVSSNVSIFGPTGQLLEPFQATRKLAGENYFEWCLRWNARQYALAAERAVSAREISGWVTNRRGYSESATTGGFSGSARRQIYRSSTRSHGQVWSFGGYGGGPVTIYNPYAPNDPPAQPASGTP